MHNRCKLGERLPGRSADAISRPRLALANVGVWLSLVEHLVRDEGVAGSNPATPTIHIRHLEPSKPMVPQFRDRLRDRNGGIPRVVAPEVVRAA
jgi:hypothetical protein